MTHEEKLTRIRGAKLLLEKIAFRGDSEELQVLVKMDEDLAVLEKFLLDNPY